MNGTVFRNKVQAATMSGVDDCLFVKLDETKKPNYTPDNCDEKNSHSVVLCQVDQGKCDSSDFKSGDKCYKKTKYDGSESNKVDWYDGQTYCSKNDIQGDIAYSYLNNNSEIKKIFDLFTGIPDPVQLWLGVRRRIWSWETDYSHEGNKPVIKYFNWSDKNIDTSNNNCIYINMNQGSKWFSQSCNGFNLPYFLCMNETTSDSTTSTRHSTSMGGVNSDNFQTAQSQSEAKSQSTKTTTMTTLINGRNKQQNVGQKEFKSVYLIAVVVSVVIVLTIIIGVTVFLVLKKRNRITKEHGYVHNDVHHSPELPNTNDPEYADIGPTKDDDTINPYGVTPAAQTVDNDIRHNKAPSGDLYAISSKQVAQSEGNINKNKDGINPEVLYARPNKKKIQDTVIEETIKSRNDADTEMPSAGENSSGSKHTEHFETETGDVYAKVTI